MNDCEYTQDEGETVDLIVWEEWVNWVNSDQKDEIVSPKDRRS